MSSFTCVLKLNTFISLISCADKRALLDDNCFAVRKLYNTIYFLVEKIFTKLYVFRHSGKDDKFCEFLVFRSGNISRSQPFWITCLQIHICLCQMTFDNRGHILTKKTLCLVSTRLMEHCLPVNMTIMQIYSIQKCFIQITPKGNSVQYGGKINICCHMCLLFSFK